MGESSAREDGSESLEERDIRRAKGNITEEEISEYLKNPDGVLFEHKIVSEKKGETSEMTIKVRALTKQFMDSTLENLRTAWDPETFENLEATLKKYFEQKESGVPGLLNVEYYIATDQQDVPIGMTGLYTIDIQGGAGFATKDRLDLEKHSLNMGLGWYSVSEKVQGLGLGKFLFNWSENLAKSRGAKHLEIETDDSEITERAVKMYKKSGYKEGFPIEDFYGPGRNLNVYFKNAEGIEGEAENMEAGEISEANKIDILNIAQKNYSKERFEEFKACLDLLLLQNPKSDAVFVGRSIVLNGNDGRPESFAIYVDGIYHNATFVYWMGVLETDDSAKGKLLSSLCQRARGQDKNVVVVYSEGEDSDLPEEGFEKSKHGVPYVFGKKDPTKLLLLTKELN